MAIDYAEFVDEYIRRNVRVQRVADREAVKRGAALAKIHKELIDTIVDNFGGDLTSERIEDLIKLSREKIIGFYDELAANSDEEIAPEVVRRELLWTTSIMAEFTEQTPTATTYERAIRAARNKPFQGKRFATHYKKAGITNSDRFVERIEEAFKEGYSPAKTRALFAPAAKRNEANVRTLVRSQMTNLAREARDQGERAYSNFIVGYTWNSVLDNRTTPHICGHRDQLEYTADKQPIGHSLPWLDGPGRIHFNCRSNGIPFTEQKRPAIRRASVDAGDNYERGDNTTRTGRVRKPTKPNRDKGIFKINQTTTATRYESWLRRQPTDFIADVLGSNEKGRKFKQGRPLAYFLPSTGEGSTGAINNIRLRDL